MGNKRGESVSKIDEMWAALEAHEPKPEYADAWRVMCKERTQEAASAAYDAAPIKSAAAWAAAAWAAAALAALAAADAVWADRYAQKAIDAIKREVKP